MKSNIIKAYKICLLKKEIDKIRKSVTNYLYALSDRNISYHKGKLDTDRLMREFESESKAKIFSIKREIIKLKNSD
jgi:hypothetical protein